MFFNDNKDILMLQKSKQLVKCAINICTPFNSTNLSSIIKYTPQITSMPHFTPFQADMHVHTYGRKNLPNLEIYKYFRKRWEKNSCLLPELFSKIILPEEWTWCYLAYVEMCRIISYSITLFHTNCQCKIYFFMYGLNTKPGNIRGKQHLGVHRQDYFPQMSGQVINQLKITDVNILLQCVRIAAQNK